MSKYQLPPTPTNLPVAMTMSGSPSTSTPQSGSSTPHHGRQPVPTNQPGTLTARHGSSGVLWIGGPPLSDWSGLYHTSPPTPLCLRNLDDSSEIKGFTKRIAGLETRFKRDDPSYSLLAFADDALRHMQLTGMDAVFYMQGADPNTGKGAEDIFNHHTKYTTKSVEAHIKAMIASGAFDQYQKDALSQSGTWLTNSLDDSLKTSLRTHLSKRPSGPVLWMLIVTEVLSDRLLRCSQLAQEFEALTLSQFKGENVLEYVISAQDKLSQLDNDGQLPRLHLLTIVNVFTACSVMDFKVHWMSRRSAVDQFLRDSVGKDPDIVEQLPNYVNFEMLLDEGKQKFNTLQKQWGPANALSSEQVVLAQVKALQAKVATLNQQLTAKSGNDAGKSKDGSGVHCFKCKKPGFTKKTCPDCNPHLASGSSTSTQGDSNSTSSSGSNKWAAPKSGESEIKTIDGKEHKYCSKCKRGKGRWTTGDGAHVTSDHKTGFLKKKKEGGQPAAALASLDSSTLFSLSQWEE